MTDELMQLPDAFEEDIPDRGIASWAAFIHFEKINEVLKGLTPLPWSVHPDPEREGTYYISGAPDTAVVAEGLTQKDAFNILYLINELPEAVEHFEELAKLWDVLVDGAPGRVEEVTDYLDTIASYQMKIAQLEANAAPIPEVQVAGDLSFMHIGHYLQAPGFSDIDEVPIVSVKHIGDFVKVTMHMDNSQVAILPKDLEVGVKVVGRLEQSQPAQVSGGSSDEITNPPAVAN